MQRVAVLGSTGSIGTNSLEVLAAMPQRCRVVAIAAHRSWQQLALQSQKFAPRWAILTDASLSAVIDRTAFHPETALLFGPDSVEEIASHSDVDTVIAAVVGAAGLRGTWAACAAGKRLCVANKETLVVAGPLIMAMATQTGAKILPVDSEHSALYQALQCGKETEVQRLILTASGGPFRNHSAEQLAGVTPQQAMLHPTWNMGPKITVDSATLMNKTLEVIEARWLFDMPADKIAVVVHPQSIVHSLVEYVDGSVMAQLSPPDMKLPIQYALTYPDRIPGLSPKMNWQSEYNLVFQPPDLERFPALQLGFDVIRQGGSCGAVLNAANEAAVSRFLAEELRFIDIPAACRAVLESHDYDPSPTLDSLFRLDRWAREEMSSWKS